MELRCANKLHGIVEGQIIEVVCRSSFCGAKRGVVVLHRFDMKSGQLKETKKYKDPSKEGNS